MMLCYKSSVLAPVCLTLSIQTLIQVKNEWLNSWIKVYYFIKTEEHSIRALMCSCRCKIYIASKCPQHLRFAYQRSEDVSVVDWQHSQLWCLRSKRQEFRRGKIERNVRDRRYKNSSPNKKDVKMEVWETEAGGEEQYRKQREWRIKGWEKKLRGQWFSETQAPLCSRKIKSTSW